MTESVWVWAKLIVTKQHSKIDQAFFILWDNHQYEDENQHIHARKSKDSCQINAKLTFFYCYYWINGYCMRPIVCHLHIITVYQFWLRSVKSFLIYNATNRQINEIFKNCRIIVFKRALKRIFITKFTKKNNIQTDYRSFTNIDFVCVFIP